MASPIQVAILDDYQGVALTMADWSPVASDTKITVFRDHVADPDALAAQLRPFQVLCLMRERTPITDALLSQLPNLKLIVSTGAHNASIDVAAAGRRGVTVCGTGGIIDGAPELTWALIFAVLRNLRAETDSVRNGGWQVGIGSDLNGQTLGIVGLGNIGKMIAKVGHAFGMNLIAWSQNLRDAAAAQHGARRVDKDTLFREADIVTIHMKLSDRSRDLVGAHEIGLMKPSAYLINTSRGPIVSEDALIDALKQRRIAGAGLDVFDTEPLPPNHPFRTLPNVVATPHIGYVTDRTYAIFFHDTVEAIRAWLDGKPVRVLD
jgi:phosphoglycerate dehydrogenase-like enzyme